MPDPNDVFTWYYVVFGLNEPKEYTGGYYLGKITCPPDYPKSAPNIRIITENGRFRTTQAICLSISDFHQESWNPAWKVNQVVIGLISFWVTDEYTYGAIEAYYDYKGFEKELSKQDYILKQTVNSRQAVLDHEKFKEIFSEYSDAIGIITEVKIPEWDEF